MNTVFLKLEGPLQSWGTSSRFAFRETGLTPTKSGVCGMICAAAGLVNEAADPLLPALAELKMGVRVDRPGRLVTDYHTAGQDGLMSAAGIIKKTVGTNGGLETRVMEKQYLADAKFYVALQGEIDAVAAALQDPQAPLFLGSKCCQPSRPVFDGVGTFDTLTQALESKPWRPRLASENPPKTFRAVVESEPGPGSRPVRDILLAMRATFRTHGFRHVTDVTLNVAAGPPEFAARWHPRLAATKLPGWDVRRLSRLARDRGMCVFCGCRADEVHHVSYERAGNEDVEKDLRSLCRDCHAAVTSLEYMPDMGYERIDPCDPKWRDEILARRFEMAR